MSRGLKQVRVSGIILGVFGCLFSSGAFAFSPLCKSAFENGSAIQRNLVQFPSPLYLGGGVYMSEITLDINNDGKADQVFSISSESDAFTGNYLIAFTGSHKNVDAFRSYMRSHTLDVDHDPERLVWSRWGAVFLSYVNNDFSPRYMDTDLFYESKNVYILFTNRSTEAKWVGGIVEMMPNNQLSVICNDP